ncbi:MAG: hypothetical protein DBX55_05735 [Verrucomicrobia bacterium]|nr:MAG: hypothetical protein DBX55_05735 [Verrucomicrobiota bacterium]
MKIFPIGRKSKIFSKKIGYSAQNKSRNPPPPPNCGDAGAAPDASAVPTKFPKFPNRKKIKNAAGSKYKSARQRANSENKRSASTRNILNQAPAHATARPRRRPDAPAPPKRKPQRQLAEIRPSFIFISRALRRLKNAIDRLKTARLPKKPPYGNRASNK